MMPSWVMTFIVGFSVFILLGLISRGIIGYSATRRLTRQVKPIKKLQHHPTRESSPEPSLVNIHSYITAYRTWSIMVIDGALRLASPHRGTVWPQFKPLEVQCPCQGRFAFKHDCGIYAMADLEFCSSLMTVVGKVALWGHYVTDGTTYRAQYAYVQDLLLGSCSYCHSWHHFQNLFAHLSIVTNHTMNGPNYTVSTRNFMVFCCSRCVKQCHASSPMQPASSIIDRLLYEYGIGGRETVDEIVQRLES